ncbi:MAG: hypothetical protein J3Q66DRAFT_364689 [Benniella sp.]|nr:MAG: hypothetical protein J3Q66DRAFT_364689 [Benniella sp.]
MSTLTTILDIPHILDTICAELQAVDIKHCAIRCKTWYPIFGPTRFRPVGITALNWAKILFLQYNGHHIRKLGVALPILKTIDGSDWTNLRELKLLFMRGDDSDESGDNRD